MQIPGVAIVVELGTAVLEPNDVVNLQALVAPQFTQRLPSRCFAAALAFCQRAEFRIRRARF
jgi:hypothetical protein